MEINLSHHARAMWEKRFSDYNILDEYGNAKPPAGKKKKKIEKLCPGHSGVESDYKVSDNGIVFVIGDNETIITVFAIDLQDVFRKGKRTRIKDKHDLKARFSRK